MKHTTLYRKWRPRAFSEIAGQEPVVRTLERAIETGRVAHAYLFSGPRGTGKTSTAKVLAMGLNCERGPTPEPDGTCENCRAIINNSSMDVVEMDAASNRGIDEIRDLRDRVNLAPVAGRTKVYIIDEVHMLTAEAFNALLKMLEEPPEHVVFILATTEKHKVLPTIVSRCQSFGFRRPGVDTLGSKLAEIAQAEGIEVEPEALTVIAREARGSFRDAEGLLDQLSSFVEGRITASTVRELLGSVGPEALLETTDALHERRAADALRVVDRLSNEGRDLGQFVGELVSHLRNLMLLPHAPEVALATVGGDERAALEEQAARVPTAEVVRLIEALGDTRGRIKRGGDPKLELELTFLKLARDYAEPSVETLLRRLEELELAVRNGTQAGSIAPEQRQDNPVPDLQSDRQVEVQSPEEEAERADAEGGVGAGMRGVGSPDLASEWSAVLQDLKAGRKALAEAVFREVTLIRFDEDVLELEFPKELSAYAKERSAHVEDLGRVLERRTGARPRLELRVAGADGGEEKARGARAEEPRRAKVLRADRREPEGGKAGTPASGRVEGERAREQQRVESPGAGDSDGGSREGRKEVAADGDVIRDQSEVFEMARERFGLFDPDGGT